MPQSEGASQEQTSDRYVALTFDDGPGPYTEWLLDILSDMQALATFFLVGSRVTRKGMVRPVVRMFQEGHEIGNHSYSHWWLPMLPGGLIERELARTQRAIQSLVPVAPVLFRPPYGATSSRVERIARRLGLVQVLWSTDTHDWKGPGPAAVADRAVDGASSGAILLLHDTRRETVGAIPTIIDRLRHRGYRLVTVSNLVGRDGSRPGENVAGRHLLMGSPCRTDG